MKLKLMLTLMGQQQEQSWLHACGHIRSTEGKVVESDEEYQKGVNLPRWSNQLGQQDYADGNNAVVSVRDFQEYTEYREALFAMFPQLDTVILEAEARKLASEKSSDFVETVEKMSVMVEHLEADPVTSTCNYFQIQVSNQEIPDSESSKPGWRLARDMLENYTKAGGFRCTDEYNRVLYNITCVQNPNLEAKFQQGRNRLEKQEGGAKQRDYILYHGAKFKNAMKISRNGFAKEKIKVTPKGFFFSTWPEIPLKHGEPNGTVILVCKVLLGNVCFEAKHTVYELRKTTEHFFDCNSMVRKWPASSDIKDVGPSKSVTQRIFIIPEPDQILPVGMFIYYAPHYFRNRIPTPTAVFGYVPNYILPNRMISPSRIDLKTILDVISNLKERKESEDANRRIKFFSDMVESYEKRDLCVKCEIANSKATASALAEFLDWADTMLENDDKFSTQRVGDKDQQEATHCMGAEDFINQDIEEILYDSEDGDDDEEEQENNDVDT